jgi:hypothetical protein
VAPIGRIVTQPPTAAAITAPANPRSTMLASERRLVAIAILGAAIAASSTDP